jgi:hypothetical protein
MVPYRPIDNEAVFWWELMPANARNDDTHKRKNDKSDKCRAQSDAPPGIVEGYFKERHDDDTEAKRERQPDAVS